MNVFIYWEPLKIVDNVELKYQVNWPCRYVYDKESNLGAWYPYENREDAKRELDLIAELLGDDERARFRDHVVEI